VKFRTKCSFCGAERESDLLNAIAGFLGMYKCSECAELLDIIGITPPETCSGDERAKWSAFKNGPLGLMMRGKMLEIVGQHTVNGMLYLQVKSDGKELSLLLPFKTGSPLELPKDQVQQ